MSNIGILHLTDLHIGRDFVYPKASKLAHRIFEEVENCDTTINLVLTTGDIFDGPSITDADDDTRNGYLNEACDFFNTLQERLSSHSGSEKDAFMFLPGNHDLLREPGSDPLSLFRRFLEQFYGSPEKVYGHYDKDFLFSIKTFREQKISLLGLNSTKIQRHEMEPREADWINKIDLSTLAIPDANVRQARDLLTASYREHVESEWHDYGEIDEDQIVKAFDQLKYLQILDDDEHTIITAFHHHIHPFPEVYKQYGDVSLIKNFEFVVRKLQKNGVRLIIHGHKHVPLLRPITNDKFLSDPNSLIYVVAGGSIGVGSLPQRYFYIVEAFNPEVSSKIATVHKVEFKGEQAEPPSKFDLPPHQRKSPELTPENLIQILRLEDIHLGRQYDANIAEPDHISMRYHVDKIIDCISNVFTAFSQLRNELVQDPVLIYLMLLMIHFRVLCIHRYFNPASNDSDSLVDKLKQEISKILKKSNNYEQSFFDSLACSLLREDKHEAYESLKTVSNTPQEKRYTALATVTAFFVDLYLTLSSYAEFYYEQIDHKINIKLERNLFIRIFQLNISLSLEKVIVGL